MKKFVRIKTEEEFISEFGDDGCSEISYGWVSSMDVLLGLTYQELFNNYDLSYENFDGKYDSWFCLIGKENWFRIGSDMVIGMGGYEGVDVNFILTIKV